MIHNFILQPIDIVNNFTLVEIDAEIAKIMTAIGMARQSASDQFSDMQASQTVKRQSVTELNNDLSVWLRARSMIIGNDSSVVDLVSATYNPNFENL